MHNFAIIVLMSISAHLFSRLKAAPSDLIYSMPGGSWPIPGGTVGGPEGGGPLMGPLEIIPGSIGVATCGFRGFKSDPGCPDISAAIVHSCTRRGQTS